MWLLEIVSSQLSFCIINNENFFTNKDKNKNERASSLDCYELSVEASVIVKGE